MGAHCTLVYSLHNLLEIFMCEHIKLNVNGFKTNCLF